MYIIVNQGDDFDDMFVDETGRRTHFADLPSAQKYVTELETEYHDNFRIVYIPDSIRLNQEGYF